jgi:hypothetical protein
MQLVSFLGESLGDHLETTPIFSGFYKSTRIDINAKRFLDFSPSPE